MISIEVERDGGGAARKGGATKEGLVVVEMTRGGSEERCHSFHVREKEREMLKVEDDDDQTVNW